MKIRKAAKKDWLGILKLIRQHPDVLVQDHLPRPGEFFIAIEDDEIAGCCALEVYSKRLAEVRSLAVAKNHQGKGVATALIEQCVKAAKKKGVRELLTITSATKLFEKHGFDTLRKEKYALLRALD